MFEYADSYTSNLDQVYTDENSFNILIPQQISEHLILGDSYNVHLGYMIQNGLGVDFRYEMANPEFDMNTESLLQSFDSYGFGISKYLKGNNNLSKVSVSCNSFLFATTIFSSSRLMYPCKSI